MLLGISDIRDFHSAFLSSARVARQALFADAQSVFEDCLDNERPTQSTAQSSGS
jgi:hypothetical protein